MILCFILGFIIGALCVAAGAVSSDNRTVRCGVWTCNGKVYQLKEIKPNE